MTTIEILAQLPVSITTSSSCLIRRPPMIVQGALVVPYADGRTYPFHLVFIQPETWTEEVVAALLQLVAEQLARRTLYLERHLVN